jgi:hypothetical protein
MIKAVEKMASSRTSSEDKTIERGIVKIRFIPVVGWFTDSIIYTSVPFGYLYRLFPNAGTGESR